ncbi:hypothetical protein [Bradyrhizobium sp. CCGB01]|uniref:hypothetical protein n=1 Tax=Bradyrhizobium sp. CCGB01 TaxID=2949634 RepID=UPI0020B2575E|nr:hypothetical protein [Bradyrhizobium sp. CCGB01]MCP3408807.1 hypothetical protein [Bradyrhizobium sp. CCGB01]
MVFSDAKLRGCLLTSQQLGFYGQDRVGVSNVFVSLRWERLNFPWFVIINVRGRDNLPQSGSEVGARVDGYHSSALKMLRPRRP